MKLYERIKKYYNWLRLPKSERRAAATESAFKKWLNQYQPTGTAGRIVLQRCYTDRNGNNWYFLPDPLQMTKERSDRLDEAVLASEYNVKKDDLLSFTGSGKADIAKARELMKNRKYKQADGIFEAYENKFADMDFRIRQIGTVDTIINIALLFFYIDHENPYTVNDLTLQRKRQIIDSDDDLRAFFLKTTWDVYRTSTGIGSDAFLHYIRQGAFKKKEANPNTTN